MAIQEWPSRLTPDEIGELIRTGVRPARPAGWSPSPDADALLDEEANAVLAAIARSARPTKASAVADDPNLLNGIDGANQRRPVRTVPFWAAVTSMAVGVIVGASFLWLGIEWTGQAESIRDAVIDIELQIEELQ